MSCEAIWLERPLKKSAGRRRRKAARRVPSNCRKGTPVKVLLFAPVYSKEYKKDNIGRPFNLRWPRMLWWMAPLFFGAEPLPGHLTDFKTAGGFGRHATLEFTFDTATAVDGQQIPVTGEIQQIKGGRTSDQLQSIARNEGAVGFLVKGTDIFVRAGTEYDLEVSGQSLIQTGAN
jgi:hypothetical protein